MHGLNIGYEPGISILRTTEKKEGTGRERRGTGGEGEGGRDGRKKMITYDEHTIRKNHSPEQELCDHTNLV